MGLKIESWRKIPTTVEAVKVTFDNLDEVARWCRGEVLISDNTPYVRVPIPKNSTENQGRAYSGKWVIKLDKNKWRVFTDVAFRRGFEQVREPVVIHQDDNYGEALDGGVHYGS